MMTDYATLSRQEIIRRVIIKTRSMSALSQKQRYRLQKEMERKTTDELISFLIV